MTDETEIGFDDPPAAGSGSARETVEFDGTTYDVVPNFSVDRTSPEQRAAVSELYRILADMLPVEGRDYRFKASFHGTDASRPSVSLSPLTELGSVWCKYVSLHLAGEVEKRKRKNENGTTEP